MIRFINEKTQWHLTTWFLITLLIYNILDFQTTYIALSLGMEEANPVVDWFLQVSGTIWIILWLKLALYAHIFSMYIFSNKYRHLCQKNTIQWTFGVLAALYIAVVMSNLYGVVMISNSYI